MLNKGVQAPLHDVVEALPNSMTSSLTLVNEELADFDVKDHFEVPTS
jgi:hypothetical protein